MAAFEDTLRAAIARQDALSESARKETELTIALNAACDFACTPRVLEPPACLRAFGLGLDATHDELRRAFRVRVLETHPDRPGGSTEAFLHVKAALEQALTFVRI